MHDITCDRSDVTSSLFPTIGKLEVLRLCEADSTGQSDPLRDLRALILENEQCYPGIERWFDRKVIPGLRTGERVGYVGYHDRRPVVSAVLKRGEDAKICHLRIREDLQDYHLGEAFFSMMSLDAMEYAKSVHFTLPYSLWQRKGSFFQSFGFVSAVKSGSQYRPFDDELRCSASFATVLRSVVQKLPKLARAFSLEGYSLQERVLMSIRPEHAQKVVAGTKRVEIRRKFSRKWEGRKVTIYATSPQSSIIGEAVIGRVVSGSPDQVWHDYGDQAGCTRTEFDSYTANLDQVYAIILEDSVTYRRELTLHEAASLVDHRLYPPQSYCGLCGEANGGWAKAVSVGGLLNTVFKSRLGQGY